MILSNGKETDFDAIYDLYADMLYRLALSHLRSAEDAEDAVHDAFLRYIANSSKLNDDEHKRAWLIRVTLNICRDHRRRKAFRDHLSLDYVNEIQIERGDESVDVMSYLMEIPEKYRAALQLHYLEGFSVAEVAEMLSVSASAVKMRLSRGREVLKELMNRYS